MNNIITENDIARIRNSVISQFCTIEELINGAIYDYYKNTDIKRFHEDMFMTGLNWFGQKIELIKRIIKYKEDIYASFLNEKLINKFIQNLRDLNNARNYFAHNSLITVTAGNLFRGEKTLDFTVDIHKKEKKFQEYLDEIWPILGWIMWELRNSNIKK